MAVNKLGSSKEEMWQRMERTIHMLTDGWEDDLCSRMQQRLEEVDPQNMSYVCSIPTEQWMAARGHFVHGGIISAMMDQGMGYLSCAAIGTISLTVNLNVSFLRSVPIGDRFYIRARIQQAGKSFVHVSGEAWLGSDPGRLVTTATGIFYARPVQRSDQQIRSLDTEGGVMQK